MAWLSVKGMLLQEATAKIGKGVCLSSVFKEISVKALAEHKSRLQKSRPANPGQGRELNFQR